MRSATRAFPLAGLCLASCFAAGTVWAQDPGWRSSISISPVREEADLDSGGDMTLNAVILRAGTSTSIGGGNRAGITLNYDYYDYSFNKATAFRNVGPWGVVKRYGGSVPFSFALQDGWSVGVAPSADWFLEDGAKSSEGLVWGATLTAVRRYDNGNVLGLGLAAFSGIEENTVFPFPIINWQLSPNWRVMNPLAAGPTGPAGLELDYLWGDGWSLGFGVAYRQSRFRLKENGPTPNGVGEISGVPVFLRARRDFGQDWTLNLYGGVVAAGEIRVEDAAGNVRRKEDLKTAPIFGANVTVRF